MTDEKTTWTEETPNRGPARWFRDVATAVGQVLVERLIDSLIRIVPRYLDLRVAAAVAKEQEEKSSQLDTFEATPADMVPSSPIDPLVIGVIAPSGPETTKPLLVLATRSGVQRAMSRKRSTSERHYSESSHKSMALMRSYYASRSPSVWMNRPSNASCQTRSKSYGLWPQRSECAIR